MTAPTRPALTAAALEELLERATKGPWRKEDGANAVWGACNPEDFTSYGMGTPILKSDTQYRRWGKDISREEHAANNELASLVPDLAAEVLELRKALDRFYQYGCPVCSGDCGSANPPVIDCPMQAARTLSNPGTQS